MIYDRAIEQLKSEAVSSRFAFNPCDVEQGTSEWLIMKLGVLSASNADKIMAGVKTQSRQTYMASLIKEVATCHVSDELPFKQLEHGKLHEPSAREALSLAKMENIKEVPFFYSDDMRCGCSPDGLYGENNGAEIKCPYDSTHFIKLACFDEAKKAYEKQCQFSMWVSGAELWTFANYDPRMTLTKQLCHIDFERDEKVMKTLDDCVPQFIRDMDKALESIGIEFGQHWDLIKERGLCLNE